MGSTNSIPIISQAKSTVQYVSGEREEAKKTQEIFLHECPIIAQGTGLVQWIDGDKEGAIETQKRCGENLLKAADAIPVIGHTKGLIHYAVGDEEKGQRAMRSASRTTGVMIGGAAGFFLAGPPGAIIGGVGTGVEVDLLTSEITGQPSGYVSAIDNAIVNPNAGDMFDLFFMPVSDAFTGVGGANMASQVKIGYTMDTKVNAFDVVDVGSDKIAAASYSPEFAKKHLLHWQQKTLRKKQTEQTNASIKDTCRAITSGIEEDLPSTSTQTNDFKDGVVDNLDDKNYTVAFSLDQHEKYTSDYVVPNDALKNGDGNIRNNNMLM